MKISSFRRYFKEAFLGLIRNRMMSLASIITVFSCVFIVTVFLALIINIDGMLKYLEDAVGISVIIEDAADAEQINSLFIRISNIPHVSRVTYMSSEDALVEFNDGVVDERYKLVIDPKVFPRSFNIEVDDSRFQPDIIDELNSVKNEGIDYVRHAQSTVDFLLTISNIIRVVCGILILMLTGICLIIITNTIKITVNARRVEINIMKFIGATDWFIRWPFIIEGFLVGLIGAILPIVICWLSYDKVISIFYDSFPILDGVLLFKSGFEIFWYIVPIALLSGVSIGVIGSVTSIRKHLNV